ncbi:hypothetical protein B0H13DRAFT_2531995 [Mycena leptocephala]|nr:hypothetical protein B0H13DRAFT_2531995 [Mycena leptocephala]
MGTDQSQVISSFVCGLTCIQCLKLDHLDQTAFDHLSDLPDLQTLTLGAPEIIERGCSSARNLHDPTYTALRNLRLSSAPSQTILTFICAISYSPLESLDIDINPLPDASSLKQIHVALNRHLPRASLTKLLITSDFLLEQSTLVDPPAVTIETIRHLFHFPNLNFVVLRPPTGIQFDDDAVLSMAEAWPHLRHLSLSSSWLTNAPPRATLRCLLSSPNVPKMMDNSVYRRVVQHNLSAWEIADSRILSPLPVARFLSGIFPKLTSIETDMGTGDEELWDEVEDFLPSCHEMREEERYWLQQVPCDRRHRSESVEV